MGIRRMTDEELIVELKLQRKEARVEIGQLREALDGVCGLTGTWAQRVGDGERDWRVRFSFEGETHFETQDEAREAGKAYERIIADAVHGETIAQLRAEAERLRAELVLAIDEAEHGHNCSFCGCDLTDPPPWVHSKDCMVVSMRDALAREDGAG